MDKKQSTAVNPEKQRRARRKSPTPPTSTPPTKSDRDLLWRIFTAGSDPDTQPKRANGSSASG